MAYLHKQKRDNVWFLIDKSKKPSWIKLGKISQAEAKQVLRKYEFDSTYLRLGLPLPPTKITFKELTDEYVENIRGIKAASTLDKVKGYFRIFCTQFSNRFIHEITAREIEEFMVSRAYKPNSWRLMIKFLRFAYDYAVKKNYLPQSPMEEIRLPKIGKSIPRFEDPKLLDLLIGYMQGSIKIYYKILRYTGMRPGEPLKLKGENIKTISYTDRKTKKKINKSIFHVKAPKVENDRIIAIHPKLMKDIMSYIKDKKPSEYLFPNKEGDGHQKSMKMGLRRAIKAAKDDEKIHKDKNISIYTFRHSVGTALLDKTDNLRLVQTVLGHSRSTTTEIYAHALEAAKINAIEAL